MADRLSILLSAYACEPGRGSEPEVGWQWAIHLSRFHDVSVLTRSNNQGPIEEGLANLPSQSPRPHFIYFDLPNWVKRVKKSSQLGLSIYYVLWQFFARRHISKTISSFDIIQHLTFNSFRLPGFWWFTGSPVVLGPLGGGQVTSKDYLPLFREMARKERLRTLAVKLSAYNPVFRISCQQAAGLVAANFATQTRFPKSWRAKSTRMLEAGISSNSIVQHFKRTWNGTILWVGTLEKWKAGELAILSFAEAFKLRADLRLRMVGTGSDLKFLQNLVSELGLSEVVEFTGKLTLGEVASAMRSADLFLFTSIRDTSGNVVLEAMSRRLPVLAIRHHGVSEICQHNTAWLVEPDTIKKTIDRFSDGIIQLAADEARREKLANSAADYLGQHFAWEAKAEQMSNLYRQTIRVESTK